MVLVLAGALAVAAVAVVAITSLGGSSAHKAATSSTAKVVTHARVTHARSRPRPAPKTAAVNPAETSVTVLNGTETTGLAHRVSGELQQTGYSHATALNGRPAGSGQVTVVEYASGHQSEAQSVARSLSVTHVQLMESEVATLANSANVVVIVGADKASSGP
jgi:LytR cell envelope-related transcriptional attenuator